MKGKPKKATSKTGKLMVILNLKKMKNLTKLKSVPFLSLLMLSMVFINAEDGSWMPFYIICGVLAAITLFRLIEFFGKSKASKN